MRIWSIGLKDKYVWQTGLTIAIVASLETLLCLDATDKLDPFKRVAPPNRELMAQGVGNMFAGFLGGLPVTQVIVRSSTNIQSGGRTKVAAIVHGIIMLVCAFAIPGLLNKIPLASLAAILFMVGYKLAKPVLFKTMYKQGQTSFVPFVTTIAGIVFVDLLVGIGLGLAVTILFILYNNYRSHSYLTLRSIIKTVESTWNSLRMSHSSTKPVFSVHSPSYLMVPMLSSTLERL